MSEHSTESAQKCACHWGREATGRLEFRECADHYVARCFPIVASHRAAEEQQVYFCGLCGGGHTTTEHYEAEWDAADLTNPPGQQATP